MRRAFKTLLLWLLLLALPVQGFAAAMMTSCHANPRSGSMTMAAVHLHDSQTMHDGYHDHHQGHHHHSSTAADSHNSHNSHSTHDTPHPHDKHDASASCSACAACCIGAAPLPANLNWAFLHNNSEQVFASPSPFMTGFIPAGIERPPRPFSA
jgi:hypothetical protein